jgi:hypothetical protein
MAAVVAEMEIVLVLFHDGFLHSYDKTYIRKSEKNRDYMESSQVWVKIRTGFVECNVRFCVVGRVVTQKALLVLQQCIYHM